MIRSLTRVACLSLLPLFALYVYGQASRPIPKSISANLNKKLFSSNTLAGKVAFEENRGQAAQGIKFVATGPLRLQLTDSSIVFGRKSTMSFVGANLDTVVTGANPITQTSNYFLGSDSSRWVQNVRNFAAVNYSNLYPGVDAILYSSEGSVRYDFKIAKGFDPKVIKLHFRGISGVAIDANGDLRVRTSEGDLWNRKPIAYQIIQGKRVDVSAEFSRLGKRTFGFKIGTYDPNYDLIIDPLLYATYLGGSRTDFVRDVAVDGSGNIYLASFVNSNDFLNTDPPNGSNQNAIRVTKLSSDGRSIIYNTLINGSNTDEPYAIDFDSSGNAYVGGFTTSPDFPLVNARQGTDQTSTTSGGVDGFVTKLNTFGGLVYSTYHGSVSDPFDFVEDLNADSAGNAYVVGKTRGNDFPVLNAFQSTRNGDNDAYVSKLSSSGTLLYSTYFGGGSGADVDAGDVDVDDQGNAFVTGTASSDGMIVLRNACDTVQSHWGFVARFNTNQSGDASLIFSSKMPNSGFGIALSSTGNAYIMMASLGSAGFAVSSIGSCISWNPSVPGIVNDLAIDASGYVYMAEYLETTNLTRGVRINKVSPAGSIVAAANLNGAGRELPEGIAFRNGYVYVAGSTTSTDFPVTQTAVQSVNRSTITGSKEQGFLAQLVITGGTEDFGTSPCQASVGAPINVTIGNMYLQQADYKLPSIGESIDFTRTYNSMVQTSGLFGLGWSSQYDEALSQYDSFTLLLNSPDGKAVYFRRRTATVYTPVSPGFFGELVANSNGTFQLKFRDGRSHNFDSQGNLTSLVDRNNNQVTLTRNANGHLTSIADSFGRSVTVTPDAQGRVDQLNDSIGLIADYHYDAFGRLDIVSRPDGSHLTFSYDVQTDDQGTRNLLTEVRNALNQIIEKHEYWPDGRAKTSERANGQEKYTLTYDQSDSIGRYTKSVDALGRESRFYLSQVGTRNVVTRTDGLCGCGNETVTYAYDNDLNLTKKVTKVNAVDQPITYTYDTANADPQRRGDLLTKADVYGTEKFTYNSFGQVLTYKDRIDSSNPDPNVNTAVYTYNTSGNLLTMKDRYGNITTFAYPTTGNVGLPESTTDPRGNMTKFQWWPGSGLLKETEDSYQKKTTYEYDARGRLKTVTDPSPLNYVTTYNYFDDSQRKVEMIYPNQDKIIYTFDVRGLLQSVTDERGKVTTYAFDEAYRLIGITDPLSHSKQYGYDAMSNLVTYTDPLGFVTDYLPDTFNRIIKITYPAASVGGTRLFESFSYDEIGRVETYIDTAGRVTTYNYNDSTRTNSVSKSVSGQTELTQTRFNRRFQVTDVTDADGRMYSYAYDAVLPKVTLSRQGISMSYEYNQVGKLKRRIDYSGRITDYGYDNLDRLTLITYGTTAGQQQTTSYSYDEISRLKTATNHVGTVSFSYDGRSRVMSTTDVFGRLLEYSYPNLATDSATVKLDGSLYATYQFDNAGRLWKVINASDGATVTYGYDQEDKLTSRAYPNGITTTYSYDRMDRLVSLNDSGTIAFSRSYGYDPSKPADLIDTIIDQNGTRQFQYDEAARLTAVTASNGQNESYAYNTGTFANKVGNRTSSHLSSTYGYDGTGPATSLNRLTSTSTGIYSHDANGNIAQKWDGRFWLFTWDYENRLTRATNRKDTVTYQYDALGRRVARFGRGNGGNTRFTYQGQDVVFEDNDGVQTKYLNGLGLDNKLRVQTGTNVNYFLSDHLGSTAALTDASGLVTATNSYDSFGNASNASFPSRYQFTGREFDNLTGLTYYRARWLDSKIGRFITEDPIGLSGGVNQFSYVRNNPVNATDPSGLYEIDVHYYLTKYLAQQNGCFGNEQARQVAEGNQQTDEDEDRLPGPGRAVPNSMYHALHEGAAPGFGSPHLSWRARVNRSSYDLGIALHYLQDTFSHEGYPNPNIGHFTGFHGVDKTATDMEKAVRMAKFTYAAIGRFASEQCHCEGTPWNQTMEDVVRRFSAVKTREPDKADILGNVAGDWYEPAYADPAALAEKVRILGVRWR